jgi:aminoacylase
MHLTFCPDEEIGGAEGMERFITTDAFRALRAGVALDEGLANPDNAFTVFYSERAVWWLQVRTTGPRGHGSRFIQNTAMEKLMRVVTRFLEFRAHEEHRLLHGHNGDDHSGCKHATTSALKLGDVVTLNLTALKGGVSTGTGANEKFALNVIPTDAMAGFDIRIPPSVPLEDMLARLREWTAEDGVTYEFVYRTPAHYVSSIDRVANPYWRAFEDTLRVGRGVDLNVEVFPAGTDGRYLRSTNIPVFGFSPMRNTPILLHDHNEFIHAQTYLDGIAVYEDLIPALADVDGEPDESAHQTALAAAAAAGAASRAAVQQGEGVV